MCIYDVFYVLVYITIYVTSSWCVFFCTDSQGHWVFASNVVWVDNVLTKFYFLRKNLLWVGHILNIYF